MFCKKKKDTAMKIKADKLIGEKKKTKKKMKFINKVLLSIPVAVVGIKVLAKAKGAYGNEENTKEKGYEPLEDHMFEDDEFEAM